MPAVRVIKKKSARRKKRNDQKPLVSHSSVLIFSGFLIGMAFQQTANPGMEAYVFAAGLIGLLGYLAFNRLARRRQQRAAQLELEQANHNLELRINRHIPQEPQVRSSRPSLPYHDADRRHLTVVNSNRYRYRYP